MRVTSVAVEGLFGLFNHEVPLQSAERVTIIHGPNGFGKTAILRMIAALIEGKKEIFEHTPFTEFSITLDDGSSRIIHRSVERSAQGPPHVTLEFLTKDVDGNVAPAEPSPVPEIPRRILQQVDRSVPGPYTLSGTVWTDGNRTFTLGEILTLFPEVAKVVPEEYRPDVMFDVCRMLQVFFVETNRLVAETTARRPTAFAGYYTPQLSAEDSAEPPTPRVKHYADDIVQRIRTVLTEYARHSQERDRTFPERLVRFVREGSKKLSEREILEKMTEFEDKRRRLISLGLLDSERGLRDLTEEDVQRSAEALTIYVGDMEEKLRVFDDLSRRIGALVDIVNSRFTYKRLTVSRDRGFRVVTDLKQLIGLADLSSGEQHEIIVLYELLFRCPQNGLVLVDEPEISLHVAWQSRFLADLINILEQTGAYAIVATHSPVIIGSRRDLTVELEGPEMAAKEVGNA
jgi:ABC-type transport system involved in cytochrome c biogenesis ATPase subunit